MILNTANLDALKKTYMTAFQAGLVQKPAEVIAFLFTTFPSTTASNMYAWLDKVPGFREWVGEREFQDLKTGGFTIKNRKFESSLSIGVDDIEDDNYGLFMPLIQGMPAEWNEMMIDIMMEVLTLNGKCFTGKPFISDDHQYGDYILDNKTTSVLSESSFEAAFAASAEWKFSNGRLCKTRFTNLMVGESNRTVAHKIVEASQHISGGAAIDNPNYGRVEVHVSPSLAGDYAGYWYLTDSTGTIKPVAFQPRKALSSEFFNNTEKVRETGKARFMADGRMAAGPTFPHLIYGGGQ